MLRSAANEKETKENILSQYFIQLSAAFIQAFVVFLFPCPMAPLP